MKRERGGRKRGEESAKFEVDKKMAGTLREEKETKYAKLKASTSDCKSRKRVSFFPICLIILQNTLLVCWPGRCSARCVCLFLHFFLS